MANSDLLIDRDSTIDIAHRLVSSRRVEGTPVYNRQDEKLGTIHSIMIEKRSGKAAYAVMSFGGFLGIKSHVHPVPWEMLSYDVDRDGYVVDLTREQLENAPSLHLDETDRPRDQAYDEEVYSYYGKQPWYWGL